MPSAWLGPQTNQCRQTRPFTGPWESCDSIRQEHALATKSGVKADGTRRMAQVDPCTYCQLSKRCNFQFLTSRNLKACNFFVVHPWHHQFCCALSARCC